MQIRDILESGGGGPVLTISATIPLLDAAGKLQASEFAALAVVEGGELVGILSERALVDAVVSRGPGIAGMTVAEAMAAAPVVCTLDDDVGEALTKMVATGVHNVPVVNDGVPVAMLTSREFRSACRVLKTQAEADDLTGLSNRRGLLPEIVRELERYDRGREPVAVAMLDVDHLKSVNDRLGHAAGDSLLRLVARVLVRETRAFDKAARIGGDEFALLFPQTRLFEAVVACTRILKACGRIPIPPADGTRQLTLSIGVTVAQAGDTAERILARADQGLYEAKSAGRGRVVAVRNPALRRLAAEPADRVGAMTARAKRTRAAEDQSAAFSASS